MTSLTPKGMITHCCNLLGRYQFGTSKIPLVDTNTRRNLTIPFSRSTEWELSDPLVIDEEVLLNDYLLSNKARLLID